MVTIKTDDAQTFYLSVNQTMGYIELSKEPDEKKFKEMQAEIKLTRHRSSIDVEITNINR